MSSLTLPSHPSWVLTYELNTTQSSGLGLNMGGVDVAFILLMMSPSYHPALMLSSLY